MQYLPGFDCCQTLLIDFSKMTMPEVGIVWEDGNLWIALMMIVFNPIYWNIVARFNYRSHFLERLMGSSRKGIAAFSVTIILLAIYRTHRFNLVLHSQPSNPILESEAVFTTGCILIALGSLLVLSSFYALGFYGTFLGDYFGIHLPRRITTFPYSIFNDPMYIGISLNHFGAALIFRSDAGIFLSLIISLVFCAASIYEEEFTRNIYSSFEKKRLKRKKKNQ